MPDRERPGLSENQATPSFKTIYLRKSPRNGLKPSISQTIEVQGVMFFFGISVKKSSLRVLGSNSKFNANKLKWEGGKQRVIKLPKNLAKKKVYWKIVRVNNNCDIINLKIFW